MAEEDAINSNIWTCFILKCASERESSDIGPESLKMWSSTQKESNQFWKSDCLTVWSFLHPRIALRFCADKYSDHANTSTSTAVAGIIGALAYLFDLYTKWNPCDPNIFEILWKSLGLFTPYYEAVGRHIQCPESALLFSTQPQSSVNSSTNPLLSTLSGSFNFDTVITVIQLLQCFRGARGFVSPYKCYKYICTRAALHQAEDYAGTKKYYFVIVTFSLIFPPLPPL